MSIYVPYVLLFLSQVPMLVPGLNYSFETFIDCLNDKGISDDIKVRLSELECFNDSLCLQIFDSQFYDLQCHEILTIIASQSYRTFVMSFEIQPWYVVAM